MWTYLMCVSFQACLVSATVGCTECTSGGSCEPSADSAAALLSFTHTSRFAMSRHGERVLAVRVYCAQERPTTTNLWLSHLFYFLFLAHISFRLLDSARVPPHWLDCPTGCQLINVSHGSNSTSLEGWSTGIFTRGFPVKMPDSGFVSESVWSELFITLGSH